MSERSELRSRREERRENGVKNLKRAKLFLKTFSYHGFGDASFRGYIISFTISTDYGKRDGKN
jgi:hypothetical protein